MAFVTDGSVHYSGIKNEGKTAKILTEKNIFGCEVKTRGGTKFKEDAVAGVLKLSAKDKKKLSEITISQGSYRVSTIDIAATRLAHLSHSVRAPSTRVGTQCCGLMARNSSAICSPFSRSRCFRFRGTPRAAAVSRVPRQGADRGMW